MKKIIMIFFSSIMFCAAWCTDYTVDNGEIIADFSTTGEIISLKIKNTNNIIPFNMKTLLDDCVIKENIKISKESNGIIKIEKYFYNKLLDAKCTLIERYYPTKNSIRCDMEITTDGTSWSVPINTILKYSVDNYDNIKYWTTWGSPNVDTLRFDDELLHSLREIKGGCNAAAGWDVLGGEKNNRWVDPLVPASFTDGKYYYGATTYQYQDEMVGFVPAQNNLFSIPMVTVVDDLRKIGFTLAFSLEDNLIDLELNTQKDGKLILSRLYNRITSANTVKFSFDIVSHEADWRSGMAWMSKRYPEYFYPKSTMAQKMGGTGSYSASSVLKDTDKLRKMAYSVNWQASFDFPYMGMFIPPVKKGEKWVPYGYIEKITKSETQTIEDMSKIATVYKDNGFYLLNYFNVCEFGANVKFPAPPISIKNKKDRWKDCNDFMYGEFPNAILPMPEKNITDPAHKNASYTVPYFTWGAGVATDCGDSIYAEFLLDQARTHLKYIPDSYGICIDRLDWLRMFNEKADDGITWFEGKPVRSLVNSWKGLMTRLGPIMHNENKVIMVNNHTRRIDLLNHVDGIFDEFTYMGNSLNLMALNCFFKPALGWVDVAETIENEGGDSFMQKYLYMGVFPMCPFPANDHSIAPNAYVDKYYLDYGKMLNLMKGREWVLLPNVISVPDNKAKANIFKVDSGYIIPIVYGEQSTAEIKLNGIGSNYNSEVYYPGEETSEKITFNKNGNTMTVSVPLKRGCAMLHLTE